MHKYKGNKKYHVVLNVGGGGLEKAIRGLKSALPRNFHIIVACRETFSCHHIIDGGREI